MVLQTLGDHRQECIGYERIKSFLSGACRRRGRVQGGQGQILNMPPPSQLPPRGRGGRGRGKNKREISENELMSTSSNKNKKSKAGTEEEEDDVKEVGPVVNKEGIELFRECMVELNKLHNSGMIDRDLYLTAMTYFQRETQTQTHPWKARTFMLLLESCRLNWLEETFRRRGDGGGGGGGSGRGHGRGNTSISFCISTVTPLLTSSISLTSLEFPPSLLLTPHVSIISSSTSFEFLPHKFISMSSTSPTSSSTSLAYLYLLHKVRLLHLPILSVHYNIDFHLLFQLC
jgi:uncharacterized protein YqgQ